MAEAGGGSAEFVAGDERMQPKVMRQLRRAMGTTPAPTLTAVEWSGMSVQALAPSTLAQSGQSCGIRCCGERVLIGALMSSVEQAVNSSLHLHFRSPQGQEAVLDVPLLQISPGRLLHAMVGRVLIEDSMQQLPLCTKHEEKELIIK